MPDHPPSVLLAGKRLHQPDTSGAGMAGAWTSALDPANIMNGAIGRSAGTSATSFTVGDGSTQGSTFTMQLNYPFVMGLAHSLPPTT